MDDLDDLLAGLDALRHILSERLHTDRLYKVLGDFEVDIRLQERHAHFAQGIGGIGLGDFPQSAEIAEGILEALT